LICEDRKNLLWRQP